MEYQVIRKRIEDSISVKKNILSDEKLLVRIGDVCAKITECIARGNKIIMCGNGGSASDALHFAGEVVGRFQRERAAWPAVALNSDVATMTAISNDYGYDEIYNRQLQAHGVGGDVFVGISTSGNSPNIIKAVRTAKEKDIFTVGLLGKDGGELSKLVDIPLVVPSLVTARIQECHIMIIHIICEIIEDKLSC